jgi:hypothetical protein
MSEHKKFAAKPDCGAARRTPEPLLAEPAAAWDSTGSVPTLPVTEAQRESYTLLNGIPIMPETDKK